MESSPTAKPKPASDGRRIWLRSLLVAPALVPLALALAASVSLELLWAHSDSSPAEGTRIHLLLWVVGLGGSLAILLHAALALRSDAPGPVSTARALPPSPGEAATLPTTHDANDRLAMIGTLTAGLAHELGQPLSVARVGVEGWRYLHQLGRVPSPQYLEQTMQQIAQSVQAMSEVIEHLRLLTTRHSSTPATRLPLASQIEALLRDRQTWLRYQDVEITFTNRARDEVWAMGDAAGLRLVLTNLLRNAVEAVMLEADDRRSVAVRLGPGPVIEVSDQGRGIPPERLPHIFEPLASTKDGGGQPGRGIGLSIARICANRMGATLAATSVLGQGSVFSLRLAPSDAPDHSPHPSPSPSPASGQQG